MITSVRVGMLVTYDCGHNSFVSKDTKTIKDCPTCAKEELTKPKPRVIKFTSDTPAQARWRLYMRVAYDTQLTGRKLNAYLREEHKAEITDADPLGNDFYHVMRFQRSVGHLTDEAIAKLGPPKEEDGKWEAIMRVIHADPNLKPKDIYVRLDRNDVRLGTVTQLHPFYRVAMRALYELNALNPKGIAWLARVK